VLLDLYAITLEQTILAEAFFTLALFGAVYLAICAPPSSIALSASGALLATPTLMHVAGAFAFLAWFLYLAWKRVGLRPLVAGVVSFASPAGLRRSETTCHRTLRPRRGERLVPLRADRGNRIPLRFPRRSRRLLSLSLSLSL
jgi:hypothetical protein